MKTRNHQDCFVLRHLYDLSNLGVNFESSVQTNQENGTFV